MCVDWMAEWSRNTQWEEGFQYLKEYAERIGNAQPTQKLIAADGFRVGTWVTVQRSNKDSMPPERKARLEALPGWTWDPHAEKWETGFRHLKEFVEREGHSQPPRGYQIEDGYRLGLWVASNRGKKRSTLSDEQKARLEALPEWSWDPHAYNWEQGFSHLMEFVAREGHSQPAHSLRAADGYKLGSWVSFQRMKVGSMPPERKARLEALPGWSWDPFLDQWEEGFRQLKEFADREGHAKVLGDTKASDGYRIGQWVAVQRNTKDNMPPERKARLEALPGWTWDILSEQWEEGFRYLKEFADREGHCLIPAKYKAADGYRLGQWVGRQRGVKDSMSSERKALLEALPDWSWNARAILKWDDWFNYLKKFMDSEGHAKVPSDYKTADGYRIGQWASNQKSKKDSLTPERKARLEALPGWVWWVK